MSFDALWDELADVGRAARRLPALRLDPGRRHPAGMVRRAGRRAGLELTLDRAGNQWAWWGDPDA